MLNKVSSLVGNLLQYKLGYTWSVIYLSFCLIHLPLVLSENSELLKNIDTDTIFTLNTVFHRINISIQLTLLSVSHSLTHMLIADLKCPHSSSHTTFPLVPTWHNATCHGLEAFPLEVLWGTRRCILVLSRLVFEACPVGSIMTSLSHENFRKCIPAIFKCFTAVMLCMCLF